MLRSSLSETKQTGTKARVCLSGEIMMNEALLPLELARYCSFSFL